MHTLKYHHMGRENPITLPGDLETSAFLDWVDEQLSIEIAELGGFTNREAEDFSDARKADTNWLSKMFATYNK